MARRAKRTLADELGQDLTLARSFVAGLRVLAARYPDITTLGVGPMLDIAVAELERRYVDAQAPAKADAAPPAETPELPMPEGQ